MEVQVYNIVECAKCVIIYNHLILTDFNNMFTLSKRKGKLRTQVRKASCGDFLLFVFVLFSFVIVCLVWLNSASMSVRIRQPEWGDLMIVNIWNTSIPVTWYVNRSRDLDLEGLVKKQIIFSTFSQRVPQQMVGGGGALRNYTTGVAPRSRGDKVHMRHCSRTNNRQYGQIEQRGGDREWRTKPWDVVTLAGNKLREDRRLGLFWYRVGPR